VAQLFSLGIIRFMKPERLLKWGFVIPTREYIGGVIGRLGLGIFITNVILSPEHRITNPLLWFGCFGCIAVGSLLARAAQRKRFQKDLPDEKPHA
jgi:hypothetical protein